MLELRRKSVRPLKIGDLCSMKEEIREKIMNTEDYAVNGNVSQNSRNYEGKIHRADVRLFYVANDNAFNSKDLLELIPIMYHSDNDYNDFSLRISVKKRIKFTVKRSDFNMLHNISSLSYKSTLERSMYAINKKFNLNTTQWEKNLVGS